METFTLICAGFFFLIFLLLISLVAIIVYSGLFAPVEVGAGKAPVANITFAYKFGRGPYKDTGYIFTEVTSIAPKLQCMGVYYDDPKEVPAWELRWAVGCIVAEGDETPDPDILASLTENHFKIKKFPAVSNAVRSSFPHTSTLSILIAIWRVYPCLAQYIEMNKLCAHPFIEIYMQDRIHFMAPLSKQDQFYVEETESDFEDSDIEAETSGYEQGDTQDADTTQETTLDSTLDTTSNTTELQADEVEEPGVKVSTTLTKICKKEVADNVASTHGGWVVSSIDSKPKETSITQEADSTTMHSTAECGGGGDAPSKSSCCQEPTETLHMSVTNESAYLGQDMEDSRDLDTSREHSCTPWDREDVSMTPESHYSHSSALSALSAAWSDDSNQASTSVASSTVTDLSARPATTDLGTDFSLIPDLSQSTRTGTHSASGGSSDSNNGNTDTTDDMSPYEEMSKDELAEM